MELKNRLYPYPVLNYYGDDYKETNFNIEMELSVKDNKLYFDFNINLDNNDIKNLIYNEKASYAVHFECPATSYRKLIKFDEQSPKYYELPLNKVDDKIQICTFIIAEKKIDNFTSDKFDDVYQGLVFEIDRHSILAIGQQKNIPIDKEYDSIKNVASIFSVIPDFELEEGVVESDFYDDIITIKLPKKQFNNYKKMRFVPTNEPIVHSLLIYPVLLQIFDYLQKEDWDMIDYKWFRSLKRTMKRQGIEFSKENLQNNFNMEKLAQEIIGFPILKSIDYLAEMAINVDGEDDEYEN